MDRIRFYIPKISAEDYNKRGQLVELANLDWRDLFVAAGFGHATDAQNKW